MNFQTLKKILLRLYNLYVKKYFSKLLLALLLSFGVAGSTAAIAWLLDPAIKKIFIEQDKSMMLLIPIAIILAFTIKGSTLYTARIILIRIGNGASFDNERKLFEDLSAVMSDASICGLGHTASSAISSAFDLGLLEPIQ